MEKKQVYTYALLVLGLVLLYFLQGNFLGYQFQPYYGDAGEYIFGSGAYDILDLYYAFPNWFDFILFLILFLGLGMYTFGDRFGAAGKSVYVAIGIILALGIVIWEAQTGFYILEIIGPYSFLLFIFLFAIMAWKWVSDLTGSGAGGVAVGIIIFLVFFVGVVSNFGGGGYLLLDFLYYSPLFAFIIGILPLVAAIAFVVFIVYLFKRRGG